MSENLLEVSDLTVSFSTERGEVEALDGVNFSLKEGEIFGLAGETGCGKSVTALSILRLLGENGRIDRGEVIFKGRDLLQLSEEELAEEIRGEEISMVFQDPEGSFDPVYTIGYQFLETLRANVGLDKEGGKKKALDTLKEVRIGNPEDVRDSYSFQLSGGMNQRAMIGMMLSANPSLLIADEPTTALDVTIQGQILSLLREISLELGTAVLLITHNLAVVTEICDRVGVMYGGSVVEIADTQTLFNSPLHPYSKGLMNAIPKKERRGEELYTIPGVVPEAVNPPSGCRFHPRCPSSEEVCRRKKPVQVEVEAGHIVACHLQGESYER